MTTLNIELTPSSSLADARQAQTGNAVVHDLSIAVAATDLAAAYNALDLALFSDLLDTNATVTVTVTGDESVSLQPIHNSFLLAGLVGASERKEENRRILTARRRSFQVSAMQKPDLVDEDALLADSSNLLAPPPAMSAVATKDDCGGREPCDDCTCGRAENKEPAKEVKSSSCGKCGMGDAFRCASCPYLGKPAFKAGEEHLVLDLQDDL